MGDHRTSPAPTQSQTRQAGATSGGRSRLSDGDHLRPPERDPVVDVTPRDGLRLRGDLLATAPILAAARRLEGALARLARPPRSRGASRLVEGRRGQPEDSGPQILDSPGGLNWVQPVWLQPPRDRKPLRYGGKAPARGIAPRP